MKKTVFSVLTLFTIILWSSAIQAQQWQWGKRAQNQTREIAIDNKGNTYVLWAIGSQANVDGHPVASNGSTDIGITSFRCDGTYRWTKTIGTTSPDAGFGLATDSLGGVYILGHIGSANVSNIYIDNDDTLAPTMKKLMLIKYDTAGNFLWQRMPEPENITTVTPTTGFNLTVELNGNVHIMCMLAPGSYAGGSFTATYPDDKNIYALKYDKNGNFTGGLHFDVTRPGTAGISPYGFNMMYDPVSTHYYWSGIRYDPYTISFGTTNITGANFLACFSNTGSVLWVQKSNNNAIATGLAGKPATDNAGNVYVAGYSYNDFNGGAGDGFGAYNFNNTLGVWSFPILVKFSSTGTVLYAVNASGNTDNAARAVAYVNGVVGIAGEYAGGNFEWGGISRGPNNQYYNDFLARFDATTGNVIGIDTLSSAPGVDEYVTTLSADRRGNFYLGGEFTSNIIIAGTSLSKQDGNTDGYIAKFGSANCNCTAPVSAFSRTGSGLVYNFAYTGTTGIDSVVWSFGDGHAATGTTVAHTYTASGTYMVCATAYNGCGTHQSCASLVATGVGIDQRESFRGLKVYPNPARNILFVTGLPSATDYQLFNSLGVIVQRGILPVQQASIDMKGMVNGWYTLRLQDSKGNNTQVKVILQ